MSGLRCFPPLLFIRFSAPRSSFGFRPSVFGFDFRLPFCAFSVSASSPGPDFRLKTQDPRLKTQAFSLWHLAFSLSPSPLPLSRIWCISWWLSGLFRSFVLTLTLTRVALQRRNTQLSKIIEGRIVERCFPRRVAGGTRRHENHHALPRPRQQHTVRVAQVTPVSVWEWVFPAGAELVPPEGN